MTAASLGRSSLVRLLLQRGADPRAVNKDGTNAYRLAVQAGRAENAALLAHFKR